MNEKPDVRNIVIALLTRIYFEWEGRKSLQLNRREYDPLTLVIFRKRKALTLSYSGLVSYIKNAAGLSDAEIREIINGLSQDQIIILAEQTDVHPVDSELEITFTNKGLKMLRAFSNIN